jgi:TolB protein
MMVGIKKQSMLLMMSIAYVDVAAASEIVIRNTQTKKMGICVGYIGSRDDKKIEKIRDCVAHDMSASDQFFVDTIVLATAPQKKDDVTLFLKQGYHFSIFINAADHNRAIEYRTYDTTTGHMIKEASGHYKKQKTSLTGLAHHIAQKIWPALTGNEGMFTSKIAYSKEVSISKQGIPIKYICVADYDGSHEQVLVKVPTLNILSRWSSDHINPFIYYSEQGSIKTRLISVDAHGHRRIMVGAVDESTAMHLVIAPDGKSAAYCASRGDGSCQIYLCKDGKRHNITNNNANNVSLSFSFDGTTLYFCSDFKTGLPQIFAYEIPTGKTRCITNGGYCASPACHPIHDRLVYLKMMEDGTMQLFLYDDVAKKNTQITFDEGSKDECCWSPCGNYIMYEWRMGLQSNIKVMNLLTGTQRTITPPNVRCSCPSWSPCFSIFPLFV